MLAELWRRARSRRAVNLEWAFAQNADCSGRHSTGGLSDGFPATHCNCASCRNGSIAGPYERLLTGTRFVRL
jgi:hypothetical protein